MYRWRAVIKARLFVYNITFFKLGGLPSLPNYNTTSTALHGHAERGGRGAQIFLNRKIIVREGRMRERERTRVAAHRIVPPLPSLNETDTRVFLIRLPATVLFLKFFLYISLVFFIFLLFFIGILKIMKKKKFLFSS